MSEKPSRQEERELLSLQAELLSLKIQAAHLKKQQQTHHRPANVAALDIADELLAKVSHYRLLQLALMPKRWTHRLLVGGVLLWWLNRSEK